MIKTAPTIWKKESCLVSECKNLRTSHVWSMPCIAPAGMFVECFHCHKTKLIKVE